MTNNQSAIAEHLGGVAAGLSEIVLRGGGEIATLAAEVHSVIARRALPLGSRVVPDAGRAPLPYRIVATSFSTLAAVAASVPRGDDTAVAPDSWRRFESALNGIMGDKLAAWDSALAIAMRVRDADGAALDLTELRATSRTGVVLFVHGLCASEIEWQTPAHRELVNQLERSGYGVAWLRYNSGRTIAENGGELAALLEAAFGGDDPHQTLILIGHSMGGLLIRSACHWAAMHRHHWLSRLTHAAYLGSAHHGVPLERVGNVANAWLGLSAYSAPFMRLGNIRSRGIKDLRFGCITPDESAAVTDTSIADRRRAIVPLPEHAHHLLVAASLKTRAGDAWIGDGLVPVASALGQHREPVLRLSAPRLQRTHLSPLGHIALMGDPRTYETLRTWLGMSCHQNLEGAAPGEAVAPASVPGSARSALMHQVEGPQPPCGRLPGTEAGATAPTERRPPRS